MQFHTLPEPTHETETWTWEQFEPYYHDLKARQLSPETVTGWLSDWSRIEALMNETYNRLYTATTLDTTSERISRLYQKFLDEFYTRYMGEHQKLKEKLIASGLEPEDGVHGSFETPLRNMRAEVEIFREENLPLLAEQLKLGQEYDRITGAQTVEWEGKETTLLQLQPVYQEPNRERRERAWKLACERQLQDRLALSELWVKLLEVRTRLAANAGTASFLEYRWKQLHRFDYNPDDCRRFHRSIEKVVVPVMSQLYEQRRQELGVESLRPWDLDVDPLGRPPLRPFERTEDLIRKAANIFQQLDPQLGAYYDRMQAEGLLDLENRKGKAPGAYSIDYPVSRKPFVFMNAVGIHEDVMTVLHECGHAFHTFEYTRLPYVHQMQIGSEIAEVASMTMELLGFPYLEASQGGFYTPEESARARREHLESILRFLPYMAVVDAFQLWAYANPSEAARPQACDDTWGELWDRFMVGIDLNGLEDWKRSGWMRRLHIYLDPLYYVEYGIAQLGAIQIWRNALNDQAGAVAAYRRALGLGSTRPLPELFEAAGARFAFDEEMLGEAVLVIREQMEGRQ